MTSTTDTTADSEASADDKAITRASQDLYGFAPFAGVLAKAVLGIKKPDGTVIALHGAWGSGKSSVINLMREKLEKEDNKNHVTVTEFKCWWYRGEDALALAFLQNLSSVLSKSLGDAAQKAFVKLAKRMQPIIKITAPLATPIAAIEQANEALINFFDAKETIENIFEELTKKLDETKDKILVIIDDVDRLDPEEALALFRIVKTIGHLPNVMYLVALDRELAERVVSEKFPSEGPHYLEKIIQASFVMPLPSQDDLHNATRDFIENICGPVSQEDKGDFERVMKGAVFLYITLPRDVIRFHKAISITWPAAKEILHKTDFLFMETIRLFEYESFIKLTKEKEFLCGKTFKETLTINNMNFKHQKSIINLILSTFPIISMLNHSNSILTKNKYQEHANQKKYKENLRICHIDNFESYCRLSSYFEKNLSSTDASDESPAPLS